MCQFDGEDCLCDFKDLTRDGYCNHANNKSFCLFDLYDCIACPKSNLIDDGQCNLENFNQACNFDGADCCPLPYLIGDGVCNIENNILMCNYDGGDCCLSEKKDDNTCNDQNNNRMCGYDGIDCCNGIKNWIGDGYCDDTDATNNPQCNFDGGDCCLDNINTQYCSACECINQEVIHSFDPCPKYTKIADGKCQDEINNLICNYDGGDCTRADIDISECFLCENNLYGVCPLFTQIGNGICDKANKKLACQYDGGDCSTLGEEIGSGTCTGIDCIETHVYDPCPNYDKIGDGQCNKENFNLICSFDAGDCKEE